MPATASDISISPELARLLNQPQATGAANISGAYGRLRSTLPSNSSYATSRFNTTSGLAQQGLNAGLSAALGSTGYEDWKNQRDYNQNMALAKEAGELNKPSLLQQVLGGINAGAGAAGQFAGLFNSLKKPKPQVNNVSSSGVASSSGAGASGYSPDFGYYYE